jgi:hypothetical protein
LASKITQVLSAIKSASVSSFLPGGGFGRGGGRVITAATRPVGGGGVGERNDCLFHYSGQEVVHGQNRVGKVFGFLITIRIFRLGLYDFHLGGGGHHKGLDGLGVKEGLGGVGEGGVIASDVISGVEVALFTYAGTLEGTGSGAEVTGRIETIARHGCRPTVRTSDRGDEGTKRNREQFGGRHVMIKTILITR